MNTFRLDPIAPLTNPRWQRSSVHECVWVRADSPQQARNTVALATLNLGRPGAGGHLDPGLYSPWLDEALTTCVMDMSRTDVPEGGVIKSDGTKV